MVWLARLALIVDRISVVETERSKGGLMLQGPAHWSARPNCNIVEHQIGLKGPRLLQFAVVGMVVQGRRATAGDLAAACYTLDSVYTTSTVVAAAVVFDALESNLVGIGVNYHAFVTQIVVVERTHSSRSRESGSQHRLTIPLLGIARMIIEYVYSDLGRLERSHLWDSDQNLD